MSGERARQLDLEKIAREAIEEARMVIPGIQALFGFQLMTVFSERFRQLEPGEQILHYAATLLIVLSIALVMAPAAYHRLVETESVSEFFVRLASTLISAAMVPLMVAIACEIYLLGRMILGDALPSALIAAVALSVLGCLWFIVPLYLRSRQSRR